MLNDPVNMMDPKGRAVGTQQLQYLAISAIINGFINMTTTVLTEDFESDSGLEIAGKIGGSAIIGGVSGMISALGAGTLGSIGFGLLSGGISNFANQMLIEGAHITEIDPYSIFIAAGASAAGNYIGGNLLKGNLSGKALSLKPAITTGALVGTTWGMSILGARSLLRDLQAGNEKKLLKKSEELREYWRNN